MAAAEFAASVGRAIEIKLAVTSKVERGGEALWLNAEASAVQRGDETQKGVVPVTVSVPRIRRAADCGDTNIVHDCNEITVRYLSE